MKSALVIFALFAATTLAQAHPGGKDKYGCHTDRKTGVYHCH
jgi:hypothetical protein